MSTTKQIVYIVIESMKSEGEFVPGCARHEFPFFIWYTYPQLLRKNAAPRLGQIWIGTVGQF